MKEEYYITVNDSVFRTKRWGLHAVVLFIGCFVLQFIVYCLLEKIAGFHNTHIEEYMPETAFVLAVFVVCLFYIIREKKTNGIMRLHVRFQTDAVQISINGKESVVKYDEITEVCKIMIIDRMHDEKGCYRMKIKCHGRSSLEFETTQQEYEAHLDFEKTELFHFYDACKRAGLKCC